MNRFNRMGSVAALLCLLLMMAASAAAAPETYYYFVYSNPTAGMEVRYNSWYNIQHAPDVVAVPGFMTAQRFVLNDVQLGNQGGVQLPKYFVVYKIVTDDLESVFKEVSRRRATNETVIDQAFEPGTSVGYVYKLMPSSKGAGGEAKGAKPGTKETYWQVVFTPAAPGMEGAFNQEADAKLKALAATPGVSETVRMELARPDNAKIKSSKYVSVYALETADPEALKAAVKMAIANPHGDAAGMRSYTYRAVGPVLSGDDVRNMRAFAKAERAK